MTDNLFDELSSLTTEARNPRTGGIDMASTQRILEMMSDEDASVAAAVRKSLPDIARAVDLVTEAFRDGGRLFYVGAGTSGRLGVLDAAECPPTFGVDPRMVQGIIAGGKDAVFKSREGSEDDAGAGGIAIADAGVDHADVVVGIAASRRTPYVLAALETARGRMAGTVLLRCNDGPAPDVKVVITVETGPEAITGSTRLKAGTATKMVLNMITTASMVRQGKVYENLMVDLRPNSKKLIERGKGIIMQLAGIDYKEAERVYDAAGRDVKVAVVMSRTGVGRSEARKVLARADGFLARTLGER